MKIRKLKISGGKNRPWLVHDHVTVTEDEPLAVTFDEAFPEIPDIVVSVEEAEPEHHVSADGISINGFTIHLDKPGGGQAVTRIVHWIAIS